MRGSGKTSVGKILAKKLGRDFLDMDEEIKKDEERTVHEIVEQQGWDYFREKEGELVEKISEDKNLVVACGGGVLMYFDNAELLKNSGKITLLTAPVETLAERIADKEDRPSLTGADFVEELEEIWKERKESYEKYADLSIETEGKGPEKIAEEIIKN